MDHPGVGLLGVILVVGVDVLRGLGDAVAGQVSCLFGAMLYAGAAIHGRRFTHLPALTTAAGTMLVAALVLVPLALVVDEPWTLRPSGTAMAAVAVLSIVCTGIALLLYFRLLQTLGSLGVASQAYLRASIGVLLGLWLLGESISLSVGVGLVAAMLGVALINWPIATRSTARVTAMKGEVFPVSRD